MTFSFQANLAAKQRKALFTGRGQQKADNSVQMPDTIARWVRVAT